ncbi:hypothetical protein [Blastococcus atacamensis]|uniref:hypothetical protein n=1 Tax=Blastococcus atacamensis TaxID=2070508 RepID=UPI000CEC7AE6|nr:hypothetical protein [Blastococcus atacamensis]
MTAIRRTVTVVGLMLAVVVGSSIPSSALYSASTTITEPVSTGRVAAPSSLTIEDSCRGWWYEATVSWPASTTSRGVTGYRVMAHLNTGESVVMAETDAATRSVYQQVNASYLNYQPRLSVITLTSYGWTAETPRSAVLTC